MSYERSETAVKIDLERDLSLKLAGDFVLAAVGDIVPAKPISQRRDIGLQDVAALLQSADATFGNMEAVIRPFNGEFEGHNRWEGPFLTQAPPEVAEDLSALGFNLLQFGSNRIHDWGIEGQRYTIEKLREAGIAVAGSGENLAEARGAAYFESAGGTVGLVSATTALTRLGTSGIAGEPRGKSRGRPGLSALRSTHVVKLPKTLFQKFRQIAFDNPYMFPGPVAVRKMLRKISDTSFMLDGRIYKSAETASYGYEFNSRDLAEIMQNIRNAKIRSNLVVAALHHHQFALQDASGLGTGKGKEPAPEALQSFARDAMRNGADVVFFHGPGHLRGVEIIDGKPAFYGLGNFIRNPYVQNVVPMETYRDPGFALDSAKEAIDPSDTSITENEVATQVMPPHPREYFETIVARLEFSNQGLKRIFLHPIDLKFDAPISDIGIPQIATGALAQKILQRIQNDNALYGTEMRIEGDVGVIEVGDAT